MKITEGDKCPDCKKGTIEIAADKSEAYCDTCHHGWEVYEEEEE